jgi:hypothetical protein
MKHLKNFMESLSEDKLYKRVEADYFFNKQRNGPYDTFTKDEIKCISDIFPKYKMKYSNQSLWLYHQQSEFIRYANDTNPTITIDKVNDEYFLIRDLRNRVGQSITFYEADTIDGVIEWINDFKEKKRD